MNSYTTVLLLVFSSSITYTIAQERAITETGKEVILFNDGSWEYEDKKDYKLTEISTNSKKIKKSDNATFLLKSKKVNVGFWLNPTKWSFENAETNPEAEYELTLKGEDLHGMVITEKAEIPLETLKSIAFENAKNVAPNLKIVNEEYRYVNGLKVLLLEMSGTMQGIKFSYYGYYFSNVFGTLQFITYTTQNLLDSYRKECDNLLNGLVEVN